MQRSFKGLRLLLDSCGFGGIRWSLEANLLLLPESIR
jgi:hypothetical protein